MRKWLMLLGSAVVACQTFTQGIAWQARYHPALGRPVAQIPALYVLHGIYAPWQGVLWTWRWGAATPHVLGMPLLAAAATMALGIGIAGRVERRDTGQGRWATRGDLRRAGVYGRHGVVLGRSRGRILRAPRQAHVGVVAGTQSRKTSAIILPTLLEWPESILAHDPKGELWQHSAGWRATRGKVVNLRPTDPYSDRYNPLDAVRVDTSYEHRDRQLIAEMLEDPDGKGHESDAGQHFGPLTHLLLQGVMAYGLHSGHVTTLGALYRLLVATEGQELVGRLRESEQSIAQEAAQVMSDLPEREWGAVLSTTRRALALWADPLVDRMTSASDVTLRDLREGGQPCSIYLGIPFGDQARLVPLTRLIIRQVLDYCTQQDHDWRYRLLAVMEELPSLREMPILADLLDYGAGLGVTMLWCTPSMNRLVERYGQHHNFLEAAKYQVFFGLNDDRVARQFAALTGTQRVNKVRRSYGPGGPLFGRMTISIEEREEPLLPEGALMQLPITEAIVRIGDGYPVRVTKCYYREAPWGQRAAIPAPGSHKHGR